MYLRHIFTDKLARVYFLKKEVICKIFKNFLNKLKFILPKPIVSDDVENSSYLNYFPYHHKINHPIEDYITLKNYIESYLRDGTIVLTKDSLT